jgi:hypothetical protein
LHISAKRSYTNFILNVRYFESTDKRSCMKLNIKLLAMVVTLTLSSNVGVTLASSRSVEEDRAERSWCSGFFRLVRFAIGFSLPKALLEQPQVTQAARALLETQTANCLLVFQEAINKLSLEHLSALETLSKTECIQSAYNFCTSNAQSLAHSSSSDHSWFLIALAVVSCLDAMRILMQECSAAHGY